MTCKLLTSDWLTALSITVIPINLTENGRETERMRTRERDGEGERENHWAPCGFLVD